jgi:hypothetical protein
MAKNIEPKNPAPKVKAEATENLTEEQKSQRAQRASRAQRVSRASRRI